ncbi:KilA-N domain-containing protein [Rhodomicrobium lacus]|uniref:KilA-N domain-containing protein n=1 Tax=Rhodomicrobium lacus TaxID=2498452 RepID=UPI0013E0927B|nr:KilA-N domain-containing protein [Rhodomicrobium lacus]
MGKKVTEDDKGNVCLNDFWDMAEKPEHLRPTEWHRQKRTQALENALLERIMVQNHNSKKIDADSMYYVTGKGRNAKTFAHPVLALAYAEDLLPALGVEVREIFLRYRAKDVSLASEILEGLHEQEEYDQLRVKLRNLVKEHNKLSVGVTNFEAYNGAGLAGLYGGLTKAQLLKRKGLASDAHHLDHAGHEELAANYFKATQATAKLKRDGIKGQTAANAAHAKVGEAVCQTIRDLGGTMPEAEPALEHISKAEKRLKSGQSKEAAPLPSKPPKK